VQANSEIAKLFSLVIHVLDRTVNNFFMLKIRRS